MPARSRVILAGSVHTIETVAVLGASEAGTACAVLAALAGCTVRLHDPDDASLGTAAEGLRRWVEQGIVQGRITLAERQRILDGVLFTSDLDEAVTGADLAVDTGAAGGPPVARLAETLRATAAVAAAGVTSPADLAASLPQPGRVLALRLAGSDGPVPRVEVEAASVTTRHVLERARAFAARVNRAARTSAPGSP